jgi:hypothetical protein
VIEQIILFEVDCHTMRAYEAHHPILSSPFEEPNAHGHILEGEIPEQRFERRPAMYCYHNPPDDTPITFTSMPNPRRSLSCFYCGRHAELNWPPPEAKM